MRLKPLTSACAVGFPPSRYATNRDTVGPVTAPKNDTTSPPEPTPGSKLRKRHLLPKKASDSGTSLPESPLCDQELIAQWKRELQSLKKRVYPQITKRHAEYGEAFCEAVNTTANQDYKEAGRILSDYLSGCIGANDIAKEINKHALPIPWEIQVEHRGRGQKPRFQFERDAHGAYDAWKDLAMLLADGVQIDRMKLCTWTKCGKLFFDSSPRGNRTTCSDKCRHARDSQTYRRKNQRRP